MRISNIMAALAVAFLLAVALAHPAEARGLHKQARADSGVACQLVFHNSGRMTCAPAARHIQRHARAVATDANGNDPRPAAWCGWWMRHHLGVADRAGNLARWWARFGTNAHGPAVGALVVWAHHVGIITGRAASGWIVKSGNDGHAVRERERSLRGAIAFRWPDRLASR